VNIVPPADKFLPANGVYATCVTVKGETYKGVTNVGIRPSFEDGNRHTVETFLLDFDGDLYNENLHIDFQRFIRPERRFESLDTLKAQIAGDVISARE
jgi:riboflavin kinase/FMN adenylyltransferase